MTARDEETTAGEASAQREPAVRGTRRDVEVTVALELGRASCTLDELLQFGENSLFELDRTVGEPVDVLLNGRVCARGTVVTVGESFGVRLTEILDAEAAS